MSSSLQIRLGTRGSALARWQADWVAARLKELGADVTPVPITTAGDRHQDDAIGKLPERGLFTKEIQRALLDGQIDLAVHSLKDLPTDPVPGIGLAAVPARAPVGDVLICRRHVSLRELPGDAVVGTGSLRRRSQILHLRSGLQVRDIRGNVDTRLRKLAQGDYDAVILAEAGLLRLGLVPESGAGALAVSDRSHGADSGEGAARFPAERLGPPILLPAVGQGALGLETRSDDRRVREVVQRLNHAESCACVLAERAMLAALYGGCLAPVAAWGRIEDGLLALTGRVLSIDGARCIEAFLSGDPAEAGAIGCRVAEELRAQGAEDLIEASRRLA